MAVANYMKEFAGLDEIWLVVSPQSPFKRNVSLAEDRHRLEMVRLAIADAPGYRVCDIEFYMPKPSYTVDTVAYLSEKYPDRSWHLIMGADNLATLHKWKNHAELLERCPVLVYPRPGYPIENKSIKGDVRVCAAPLMEISASFIRTAVREGRDVRFFCQPQVWEYLSRIGLYDKA